MEQLRDLQTYLLALQPGDVLDILLVSGIIYGMLYLVRGTRAIQLLRGVLIITLFVFLFSRVVRLTAFTWLVNTLLSAILISVPVIFQPELRRGLERLGRAGVIRGLAAYDSASAADIAAIVAQAARQLSEQRWGGLIVLERDTSLDYLISSAARLEAVATAELLMQIFYPKTPLHDGAVIIRDGRVLAARVVIPLGEVENDEGLGTRHLAAVTISDLTDALVVVVSEERATISLARNGHLTVIESEDDLARRLRRGLRRDQRRATGILAPLQEFWDEHNLASVLHRGRPS